MSFAFERRYTGPVQAVLFDWAGTIIDHGSIAPILALQRLFEANGVPVSETEARIPMGREKWIHIRDLCALPAVHERWVQQHGAPADKAMIDRLYQQFLPLQIEAIATRTELLDGLVALSAKLRTRGIKVGTNTGYSREMLEPILTAAAIQGFVPDSTVCATEVSMGRPYPFMSFRNMMEMQIENVAACVKVDDTQTGIEEGLNAGMWTVAVALSGNEIGLSKEDWLALPEAVRATRTERARAALRRSGAHYVIDSVADLEEIIEAIDARLARGDKP